MVIKENAVYRGGLRTQSLRLVTKVQNGSVTYRAENRRSRSGWTRIQFVDLLDEFSGWVLEEVPQHDKTMQTEQE